MKEEIYLIIKNTEKAKKERKQVPSYVLQSEIATKCSADEKKRIINELFREGKIGYCRTLNQLAFYIKLPQNENEQH